MTKLKTSLTFRIFYYFSKKFLLPSPHPTKKSPDWVTSLGDYDEKSFRISLNKVRRSLFNDYIILDQP